MVQTALEKVVSGSIAGLLTFDLLVAGVFLEDGCASKAKELGVGEEFFNGFMVVAKL